MKDYIWEAECEYYNYYYSGQGASDEYSGKRKLLYDKKYKNLLYIDKWIIDGEPSWDEIFSRDRRFINHCKKLGIPNPYSLARASSKCSAAFTGFYVKKRVDYRKKQERCNC